MNNICILLVCIISYFLHTVVSSTVSFTADGTWSNASNSECEHFMCTSNGLTWRPNYDSKFYNNVTGCEALLKKNITKIIFFGDSFMRQIYAAMLITLNGDYKYGSQADPTKSAECQYHRQFYEKRCGTHQLNHVGKVCDGKILLDPLLHAFHGTNHCSKEEGTVVIWSFANYKLFGHSRYDEHCGVNNATMYQAVFEQDVCPQMREKIQEYTGEVNKKCSVWWISTHYRVKGYFHDETPEKIKQYNEDMRNWYGDEKKNCGNVNYVDVYNMTARLTIDQLEEAKKLTYDSVHWGFEVNLIKAQIILNALISSPLS
jgi:hypothetical protein